MIRGRVCEVSQPDPEMRFRILQVLRGSGCDPPGQAVPERNTAAKGRQIRIGKSSVHHEQGSGRLYYKRPVIVLIDEYDTPVVNAARGGYYDEMADFVRDFFGYTFAANAALKFGVLTGVMPITKKSLFGGLDSLRHYGVSDSDYADAIGFTQDEVDTLLAKAGLSSKREEVMDWYGGYRFGGTQAMYCPWNVQNYVVDHKRDPQLAPKAYWLGTGGNDLLQRLVAQAIADPRDIDALLDGWHACRPHQPLPRLLGPHPGQCLFHPPFHGVSDHDQCEDGAILPAKLKQGDSDHSQQGS